MKKIFFIVVGTRPNFMKAAPVVKELKTHSRFNFVLVHTGQHYDYNMSKSFFNNLGLPRPNIYLGVGSGSHTEQTGKIMIRFEKVCLKQKPDLVIVVGDVNSTIACALAAAKLNIPVAHVEGGLRSFDKSMPEEINRILTDQISDYLFTTCKDANQNLIREGIPKNKIFFVGNVMVDTLLQHIGKARKSNILERLGFKENGNVKKYALVTLHRPSNVDDFQVFSQIINALNKISSHIPIIFPIHPRTMKEIKKFKIRFKKDILTLPPLGYLDFLCLMSNAALVLTDSGGIQEETTILAVPCLTLRNNTERPITIKEGTNIVVGTKSDKIVKAAFRILKCKMRRKKAPKYWDGKTAVRIVKILSEKLK